MMIDGSGIGSASVETAQALAEGNKRVFEQADVVDEYSTEPTLRPAEQQILRRYEADFQGKTVLDLGVGGGRTAPFLAPHAAFYVGIDFSEAMIASCRKRFPQWTFQIGDARDLGAFATGSIDFLLFSYNGIDYVGDEDRSLILAEIRRVLKDGGVFAFSSHNLAASEQATWRWTVVLRPRTPAAYMRAFRRAYKSIEGRLRSTGKQVRAGDYAILNDPAHQFGLLTYYIGAEAQTQQLRKAGFAGLIEIFGEDGRQAAAPVADPFLHYVVRK